MISEILTLFNSSNFKELVFCILFSSLYFVYLYKNRIVLLYEDNFLSMGRIWGWVTFYLCLIFWIRVLFGLLPSDMKMPDGLMEMLYSSLAYNLGKFVVKEKYNSNNSNSNNDVNENNYNSDGLNSR
jgi:apolipoprotein N-acyltransferase